MKTNKNKFSGIIILFTLAIFLFPFKVNAQIFVNASNKVGIGTASPGLQTHIIGDLDFPATSGTTQKGVLRLQGIGSNIVMDFSVKGGSAASCIQVTDQTNLSYANPLVLNPNAGNVGIGILAPTQRLEVNGNIRVGASNSFYVGGPTDGGTNGTRMSASTGNSYFDNKGTGGIYFRNDNTNGGTGRMVILNNGNVGIATMTPGSKLDVNGTSNFNGNMSITGTVTITGSGTVSGTWTSSDAMFKTNVDTLTDAVSIIRQLKPKSYFLDTANYPDFHFASKKQYGFLAQDVELILPELISTNVKAAEYDTAGVMLYPERTYKALNYVELIGILTKGIQEQQKTIETLQGQMSQLSEEVTNCCNNRSEQQTGKPNNTTSSIDIDLKDGQSVVLEQNVPNPFAEQTTINYFLPENTTRAQMLFYNSNGKLIQSVDLNQKGKGSINVFASDLSNGVYTYTLVVDGKIIETKKMIKQQ